MRTKRSTPRLDVPAEDKLNQTQRALRDAIASGPRGTFKFTGPFAIWLHAPEIGQLAQALGAHCRYKTTLSPRLSEFAILTTARAWRGQDERQAHPPTAGKNGGGAEKGSDLPPGREPQIAAAAQPAL